MPFAHLALIGNALPRKCGLATFTSHVADALAARYPGMKLDHYAMDDGSGVDYPPGIVTIDDGSPAAYRDAATAIEASGADASCCSMIWHFRRRRGSHSRTDRAPLCPYRVRIPS